MKSVFVASSRRFYDLVKEIKSSLDKLNVKGYYPYFELGNGFVENDEDKKKQVTLKHFPEIDEIDVFYIVAKDGYVGCSVIIEMTYAYAKGKEIISSEPINELAARALVSKVMSPEGFVNYVSK